jgi:hypothetical protein
MAGLAPFHQGKREKKKGEQKNEQNASFNVERDVYIEEIPEDESKSCGSKLSQRQTVG